MKLENKIALITGGSRGIGRGIALGFAREGADVIVNYCSNEERAREVVASVSESGRKSRAIRADMGDMEQVASLVEEAWDAFGRIDILVNNAGIAYFESFLDLRFDQWRRVLAVNLDGVMLCSQLVARKMVAAGIRGKIIKKTFFSISSLC